MGAPLERETKPALVRNYRTLLLIFRAEMLLRGRIVVSYGDLDFRSPARSENSMKIRADSVKIEHTRGCVEKFCFPYCIDLNCSLCFFYG